MAIYDSAGVYVEIEDFSQYVANNIVHTSALLVVTEKGPINVPTVVFSWRQFVAKFGSYGIENNLDAFYVKKFFDEGGGKLWVVSIGHYTDITDTTSLASLTASYDAKDAKLGYNQSKANIVKVEASSPKSWGNNLSLTTRKVSGTTTVALANTAKEIVLDSVIGFDLGDKIEVVSGATTYTTIVTNISRADKKLYIPAVSGLSGDIAVGATVSTCTKHKLATRLATGQTLASNAEYIELMSVDSIKIGSVVTIMDTLTANGNAVSVLVKEIDGKKISFDSVGTITSIAAANSRVVTQEFDLLIKNKNVLVDILTDLSVFSENTEENIAIKSKKRNSYITCTLQTNAANAIDLIPSVLVDAKLTGGDDALDDLADSDYIGDEYSKTGLHALDSVDDIDVIAIPGNTSVSVLHGIIAYLDTYRKFDYAYLDVPSGLTPQDAVDFRYGQGAYSHAPFVSHRVGMHEFWEKEKHPITGEDILVPPSVLMCGRCSRSYQKTNPNYAVAGPQRTVSTCLDIEYRANEREDGFMSNANINVTRVFPEGMYVNGQKTLSNQSSRFDRANVVHMLNRFSKKLMKVQQFIKFEPNDEDTWRSIVKLVDSELKQLKKDKGIVFGKVRAASSAYDLDNSTMVCEISMLPMGTAEKIINKIKVYGYETAVEIEGYTN